MLASSLAPSLFKGIVLFDDIHTYHKGNTPLTWAMGGLLVGLGTALANGCTSGHGVCGLPRLSKRSLVAVLTFMTTGIITASLHSLYSTPLSNKISHDPIQPSPIIMLLVITIQLAFLFFTFSKQGHQAVFQQFISLFVGFLFSIGLLIAGMARKSKILGFLTINQSWDYDLIFVMAGAVLFNLVTFQLIFKYQP